MVGANINPLRLQS